LALSPMALSALALIRVIMEKRDTLEDRGL